MATETRTLEDLEREADEATLAFWEALQAKDQATVTYKLASDEMYRAKIAYLEVKLGRVSR